MDNLSLIRMEAGDLDDVKSVLKAFNEENIECFKLDEFLKEDIRERLWAIIFKHLESAKSESVHEVCLTSLRILVRDKTNLEKLIDEHRIDVLLQHSALKGCNPDKIVKMKDHSIPVEALKCLANLSFNSLKVQNICSKNGTIDGLIRRLKMHPDPNLPYFIKYFDMKILFLISALNLDVRSRLRDQLHALTYLMEALDFILKEGGGYSQDNHLQYFPALDENAVELSCEILKVLFNLTVKAIPLGTEDEVEPSERLIIILRELLLSSTPPHMHESLCSSIINLLTNMPSCSYEMLMPQEDEEYNSEAVDVILNFLENKLSKKENYTFDVLSPVLTFLLKGTRYNRSIRKYVRMRILPPLKDVKTKPEKGTELRNHLVRFLTGIDIRLRDLVGELLFVLCKENAARMVKYTGFANAAGMFAARGLLNDSLNTNYSSDSDDSDTEEYLLYKEKINPIIGCYEPPKPNPTDSMSEEQKEFEVMKLVNAMDQLQRQGIVQPCKIGEDGKPQPVDHIVQLQDELPKQLKQ